MKYHKKYQLAIGMKVEILKLTNGACGTIVDLMELACMSRPGHVWLNFQVFLHAPFLALVSKSFTTTMESHKSHQMSSISQRHTHLPTTRITRTDN